MKSIVSGLMVAFSMYSAIPVPQVNWEKKTMRWALGFLPLIGVLTGGINFAGLFFALDGQSYASIEAAAAAGVGTVNYGLFIQNVINFLLTAFCMFLVVRTINKLHKKAEPAPAKPKRICPFCKGEIADDATRCPHCTSMLE